MRRGAPCDGVPALLATAAAKLVVGGDGLEPPTSWV